MDDAEGRRWLARLVEDADVAGGYLRGVGCEAFTADPLARDAVERRVQRAAEAATRAGPGVVDRLAPAPAEALRRVGDALRDATRPLDPNLLWTTATEQLPALREACARALAG